MLIGKPLNAKCTVRFPQTPLMASNGNVLHVFIDAFPLTARHFETFAVCAAERRKNFGRRELYWTAGHNTDSRFISSHKQSLFAVYWGPFAANFVGKINKGRCVLLGSWCG